MGEADGSNGFVRNARENRYGYRFKRYAMYLSHSEVSAL